MLASSPGKRFTEIAVLLYTPVWILAILWAMASGVLPGWGDFAHLAFGVALAAPVVAIPFVRRQEPLALRHATRFLVLIAIFTFLQCWFGSQLFFDVFGMEYHFHTSIVWNGTPAFLYLVTIAYFATYYTVMVVAWRAIRRRFPGNTIVAFVSRAVLAYVTAFAETAGMANDMLAEHFSYTDRTFVMVWGSFAYGAIFFVTLPLFYDLDEETPGRPDEETPDEETPGRPLALDDETLGRPLDGETPGRSLRTDEETPGRSLPSGGRSLNSAPGSLRWEGSLRSEADVENPGPLRRPLRPFRSLRSLVIELLALTMICLVVYEVYEVSVGPFAP
jgi:cycloeucalenol cycloisomerase